MKLRKTDITISTHCRPFREMPGGKSSEGNGFARSEASTLSYRFIARVTPSASGSMLRSTRSSS